MKHYKHTTLFRKQNHQIIGISQNQSNKHIIATQATQTAHTIHNTNTTKTCHAPQTTHHIQAIKATETQKEKAVAMHKGCMQTHNTLAIALAQPGRQKYI